MPITGAVKFFEVSRPRFRDGGTSTVTSGEGTKNYLIDDNTYTQWESIGSDDTTTETIILTFPIAENIDRVILAEHNWKEFTVKYWNGSAYVDFTTVLGYDGSQSDISETANTRTNNYYEFDSVNTTMIEITVTKTHVVDDQKYINRAIITEEIGTFQGYPRVSNVQHNRHLRKAKTISGKTVIQKSFEATSFRLAFRNYPKQNDITIIDTLHDQEESFLVWLSGGREGAPYFNINQRGWGISDIYTMQVSRPLAANYSKGIYVAGADTTLALVEAV